MNDLKQVAGLLSSMGRNGDTMLAHITPEEANLLKSAGGSATINPNTGLPEFFKLKDIVKVAAPIVGFAFGGPAGAALASAGTTIATGGKLEDALKGALLSYGAGSIYNAFGGGSLGISRISDASFVAADAAQLAAQGLNPDAIIQNLSAAGVNPLVAADAAQLASQGLSANQMSTLLAQSGANQIFNEDIIKGSMGAKDALRMGQLASQLGAPVQPQSLINPDMAGQSAPRGVDYREILALISQKAKVPGLLGTRFQPEDRKLAPLLG